MLRTQRIIRFFGAEGICGLPAWSWQSYMRTSLASHGNSPNTPRVAKAGNMFSAFSFLPQSDPGKPPQHLRIERIKYIQRIIQNKPMGEKRECGDRGKVLFENYLAALEKGSEKKQQKSCFASKAARTHPHHSQLLPGCFLTPGNSTESFRTLFCRCLREPVTFPWGGFKASPAPTRASH